MPKTSGISLCLAAAIAAASLIGCGGGGNGEMPAPAPAPRRPTTFRGNLASATALRAPQQSQPSRLAVGIPLSVVGKADAQDNGVQVCIEQTTFCSGTDANGSFVLIAPVAGNLVLIFTGIDFTARLRLTGIPMGAVVTIQNIDCNTATGRCEPQRLDVEAEVPTPTTGPIANQSPVCSEAVAIPAVLFPPNHELVPIVVAAVTDPDGDDVAILPTNIVQDEPVLGTGSGDTAPDATLSPLTVRAERSGQGNGRVYTIDFVADDGHGGSCVGRVQICVPHDQRPGATCIDDGIMIDSTS